MNQPDSEPGVAIIVPAFCSQRTIGNCLRALTSQSYGGSEVIVVDSSPDHQTSDLIQPFADRMKLIRSEERLLPHAARNLGAQATTHELLVFTDPDIYPPSDWLERLVQAHLDYGDVIVGSIACHNPGWLERGIHFGKFDSWLPGGEARQIEISMTGNMLCPRTIFEDVGGFDGQRMLGDTLMSWCLEKAGFRKTFVPNAVVYHDHDENPAGYLKERMIRGREFALLRTAWAGWSSSRVLGHFILTLSPLRLARLLVRGLKNARRANLGAEYLLTFPVSLLGQAAWLAGEAAGYTAWLLREADRETIDCGS